MTTIVQNLRGARRLRVVVPLLPAALLPLALAGVTVPAATGIGASAESLERVEERARRVDLAERRIAAFGAPEQLDEVRRAVDLLRRVVPEPESEAQLFNRVRFLGEQLGLVLSRCDVGGERDLDVPFEGETVFARELSLAGTGTLTALVDLLAQLRAQGAPVAVLDAALSRGAPAERDFQFTMRLAVLHRAPVSIPGTGAQVSSDVSSDPANPSR